MSDVRSHAPTFFDLYSRDEVPADRIGEFVSAWHGSDSTEQRSLAAYLGLTDDEYRVWLMDTDALPRILLARRTGRTLRAVMRDYVATLRRAGRPQDRSALHALQYWLESPAGS